MFAHTPIAGRALGGHRLQQYATRQLSLEKLVWLKMISYMDSDWLFHAFFVDITYFKLTLFPMVVRWHVHVTATRDVSIWVDPLRKVGTMTKRNTTSMKRSEIEAALDGLEMKGLYLRLFYVN